MKLELGRCKSGPRMRPFQTITQTIGTVIPNRGSTHADKFRESSCCGLLARGRRTAARCAEIQDGDPVYVPKHQFCVTIRPEMALWGGIAQVLLCSDVIGNCGSSFYNLFQSAFCLRSTCIIDGLSCLVANPILLGYPAINTIAYLVCAIALSGSSWVISVAQHQ